MINDQEIKKLILSYQQTGENLSKIKEILSEFIYHFPAIAFETYNEDIKGDFYLYSIERLEKVLKEYKVYETAQFKTFFYLVLRRHYLNFIQARKPKIKEKSLKGQEPANQRNPDEKMIDLEKISLLFASLPPKYRLILKIRCPDFLLPEDLILIGKEFRRDPVELLKRLETVLKDMSYHQDKKKKTNLCLTSPRAIGEFLDIRANLVSKWLTDIKKIAEEKIGELYVS